jgi:hypothetical protein
VKHTQRNTGGGAEGFECVADLIGHGLERGTGNVAAVAVAAEADEGGASIGPPVREAETGKCRNEVDAVVADGRPGESLKLRNLADEAESVAQPSKRGGRTDDQPLEGVGGHPTVRPRERREHPAQTDPR